MSNSRDFRHIKRCIIKIGSAMLTANGRGLDTGAITHWVEQVVQLLKTGVQPILVSSGAVAEGMNRLGWQQRPHALRIYFRQRLERRPGKIEPLEELTIFLNQKVQLTLVFDTFSDNV